MRLDELHPAEILAGRQVEQVAVGGIEREVDRQHAGRRPRREAKTHVGGPQHGRQRVADHEGRAAVAHLDTGRVEIVGDAAKLPLAHEEPPRVRSSA